MKRRAHELQQTRAEIETRRQELDQKIADFNAAANDSSEADTPSDTDLQEASTSEALSGAERTGSALGNGSKTPEQGLAFAEVFAVDESQVKEDIWRMIGDVRFDVKNASAVMYARQPATARGVKIARWAVPLFWALRVLGLPKSCKMLPPVQKADRDLENT